MNIDVTQRWRTGHASYRPAGEVINTASYEVAEIDRDTPAKAFILAHHYAASYPAARFRYGLYRHGELAGVAVFSVPANMLALRPFPRTLDAVELGRFVLLDDVPANGETWFLARAFELLRRAGVGGIISFSDPQPRTNAAGAVVFPGHLGTIYQAHNACFLGRSRPDKLRLLADGRALHNRAISKVRRRDRGWRYVVADLVKLGADAPAAEADLDIWIDAWLPRLTRRMPHPGNLKYAWSLDRAFKLPPSERYPKVRIAQLALAC